MYLGHSHCWFLRLIVHFWSVICCVLHDLQIPPAAPPPPPPQPFVEITVRCPCCVVPAGVVTCVLVLTGQACALCVWILTVYADLLTRFCNAVVLCELSSAGSLVSSKLGEKIDLWIFVVYVSFFWSKWGQETAWFLHTLYVLYCNKWGLASLFVSVCVHHTCYFAMSGACLFIFVCLSLLPAVEPCCCGSCWEVPSKRVKRCVVSRSPCSFP